MYLNIRAQLCSTMTKVSKQNVVVFVVVVVVVAVIVVVVVIYDDAVIVSDGIVVDYDAVAVVD